MACSSCGTDGGKSKGCRSNGGCDSGGCNKLNTYDWLSTMELDDPSEVNLVEVSFRNGAHKSFFRLQNALQAETGDTVVVEADGGYDVGEISLKGALVPLQMKKKSVDISSAIRSVMRVASQQDFDKLLQARGQDKNTMVRARAISAMLGIDMKIGDVEFRADLKKATFYYTADGRVDFRELIRHFAKEFRVKIEMRQIGSRQESSRIGGLGSCGRELCCSTWLTDYKSVTTNAARYQNLSINQAKLSGQCGRLKCCLNYELDVYMEALEDFPTNADTLQYATGYARLIKTDIFKKLMFYIKKDQKGREAFITMTVDEVIALQKDISKGRIPQDIVSTKVEYLEDEDHIKSEDLTGHLELPDEKRRKKKKNKNRGEGRSDGAPRGERPEGGQRPPRDGGQRPPREGGRPGGDKPGGERPNREDRRPQNGEKREDRRPQSGEKRDDRKPQNGEKREDRRPQNGEKREGQQGNRNNQGRPERNAGPRVDNRSEENGEKRNEQRNENSRSDRKPDVNRPDQKPRSERPDHNREGNQKERRPDNRNQEKRPESNNDMPQAPKPPVFPFSGGQESKNTNPPLSHDPAVEGQRPENLIKKRNNHRRKNNQNRPPRPGNSENNQAPPQN